MRAGDAPSGGRVALPATELTSLPPLIGVWFRVPSASRPPLLPLAGLVLVVDGLAAWLLAGVSLLMSTAVAAVEGQTGNPNGHLVWWALGLFVVGIVAFAATWQAVRGARWSRVPGALVAGGGALVAAFALWSSATTSPVDLRALAVTAGVLIAQLAAVLALVTWPQSRERPSVPNRE